ncbi:MAG: NAD(P)H-dependent glycerol-3-phosphate dehydrogenase [Bacillus sp. (in: firmicutes)]
MGKIAVLGAGSWGTALSIVLADNGHEVRLWGHSAKVIDEINGRHSNEAYLPKIQLPNNINGYTTLSDALHGVTTVLLVVPTKAIREVLGKIRNIISSPLTIIHASKGLEPKSYKRISEIVSEEIPNYLINDIVALSGPSHAEEVALRQPTTITAAAENIQVAQFVQNLFMNPYFRVYTNNDVIGVEIGGALKNIIALGAGISDGLGYGDNAKAAIVTRGLNEITRLGLVLGANPLTFIGLSGVGDLLVTCTSIHSRNWRAGQLFGKGYNLEEVLNNVGMVVEGIRTAEAVYHLSKIIGVEMPITNAIFDIIFKGQDPRETVGILMNRDGKGEAQLVI